MIPIKKYFAILLTVCLAAALVSCSSSDIGSKIAKLEDLEGRTIATLSAPMPIEMMKSSIEDDLGFTVKELLYFDTTGVAVAALKSNKADGVMITDFTAEYYVKRNSDLTILNGSKERKSYLHMAMRAEDTELRSAVNDAILSMKNDGTLDELKQTYMTDLKSEDQLAGKNLPKLPDAPTVYVGISGGMPPLDYIAADGRPAGYSLEVLSEISKRSGYNFEVVAMTNEAKFTALTANKIDLFFYHVLSGDIEATTATAAANPKIVFSEPYYTFDKIVYIVRK